MYTLNPWLIFARGLLTWGLTHPSSIIVPYYGNQDWRKAIKDNDVPSIYISIMNVNISQICISVTKVILWIELAYIFIWKIISSLHNLLITFEYPGICTYALELSRYSYSIFIYKKAFSHMKDICKCVLGKFVIKTTSNNLNKS